MLLSLIVLLSIILIDMTFGSIRATRKNKDEKHRILKILRNGKSHDMKMFNSQIQVKDTNMDHLTRKSMKQQNNHDNDIRVDTTTRLSSTPVNSSLELKLAKMYAPIIRLSKFDTNFPASVEHYLKMTNLKDENGKVISENVTPELLKTNGEDTNYLEWKLDHDIGVKTGEIPEAVQETKDFYSPAPVYARVFDAGDNYRVVYAIFWPLNGYQTFSGGFGFPQKKINFEWAHFAEHQSDFENIQVFISKDHFDLVKVAGSRHGESHVKLAEDVEKVNNRPVLYSAWNSHAIYFDAGVHTLGDVPGSWLVVPALWWLKLVDITATEKDADADHWEYTNSPASLPYYVLDPLLKEEQLVIINDKKLQDDPKFGWLYFNGTWGPTTKHDIGKPPNGMPEGMPEKVYNGGKLLEKTGTLSDKLVTHPPLGPRKRDWWQYSVEI